ncbi:MAG: DMT family transporter [Ramlibacter sp.]
MPTLISICLAPVIVALVSVLRAYEPLTGRLMVVMTMALSGVGLMVWPADGLVLPVGYLIGVVWSVASACAQAFVVLGNARMPARLPAVAASAWSMTAACACMLVVAVPHGVTWPNTAMDWLGVAHTGAVTTSLAYLVFAISARRLTPTASIIGIMVEPLVAMLLAAWLFAESMNGSQWIGAVLLCAAVGLLARQNTTAPSAS